MAVLYQLCKRVSKDFKVCTESMWFLLAFYPFKLFISKLSYREVLISSFIYFP